MSFNPDRLKEACLQQDNAAHDLNPKIRLIAGPGTGKSTTIIERIRWLLSNGHQPKEIAVVSFTRASARDLQKSFSSIYHDQQAAPNVQISTLHSLALKILKKADQLDYPDIPVVLDPWETRYILETEFQLISHLWNDDKNYPLKFCTEIRLDYEAFCNTGTHEPKNFVPPKNTIGDEDRELFIRFHDAWTQLYSCLLPGEVVRECYERMNKGLIDPVEVLNITHLIVDEYQDLNPIDIKFIDYLANSGIHLFVCGDDDQSIYSFRYASSDGIKYFEDRHKNTVSYELTHCFRCTPEVLSSALSLISAYPGQDRLEKHITSMYENSIPRNSGLLHLWKMRFEREEAQIIASTCKKLIDSGVAPSDIMILICNTKVQLKLLSEALTYNGVEFDAPKEKGLIDTPMGRLILGLLRVVVSPQDYIAHRLVLGSRIGIGIKTICSIALAAHKNGLNYRDLFHYDRNNQYFDSRALNEIKKVREICLEISHWDEDDSLQDHLEEIKSILQKSGYDNDEIGLFELIISNLPIGITLKELLQFLLTDQANPRKHLVEDIVARLGIEAEKAPEKVQIMTMHGAKGLSSKIVFIPGLEKYLIPGQYRERIFGLVEEAARLLYVSITRARSYCFLSYSKRRMINGMTITQSPSPFNMHLGRSFENRILELSDTEIGEILSTIRIL